MAGSHGVRLEFAQRAALKAQQKLCPLLIEFSWLLQLSGLELEAAVARELEENPALEIEEPPARPDRPWDLSLPPSEEPEDLGAEYEVRVDPLSLQSAPFALRDFLRQSFALHGPADLQSIASALIEEIDDDGRYQGEVAETAARLRCPPARVEQALAHLQMLEPVGVGARDLRECLLLQARARLREGRGNPVAVALLESHWELLLAHQYERIARQVPCSVAAVRAAAEFIAQHLSPYPGRSFRPPWGETASPPRLRPDLIIRQAAPPKAGFEVEVVGPQSTRVCVSRLYQQAVRGQPRTEGHAELSACVLRAERFVRQLARRRDTLLRVARVVVARQQPFLELGRRHLAPLTRTEVGVEVHLHETTVGRAVAGTYVLLPSGELVPFSLFFMRSLPATELLASLIAAEDVLRPLSDAALCARMAHEGVCISRRTVAKYRQALHIGSRAERRRRVVCRGASP